MIKRGVANLPLHRGKAPRWLFRRMVELSGEITKAVVEEYGSGEFVRRIADPFWFQALSCTVGFDWHSSGTTTTTTGALKAALEEKGLWKETGIRAAGGKGTRSRRTLQEIETAAEETGISTKKTDRMMRASRMSAKVDSSALQDGYQLYHHAFFFTENGKWTVVQQGMNDANGYARRYHWMSDGIKGKEGFVREPHTAICSDGRGKAMDMTATISGEARKASVDIVNEGLFMRSGTQKTLAEFTGEFSRMTMPPRHAMKDMNTRNLETLRRAYEIQPSCYEELLEIKGVGPKTVRALALTANLVYGSEISWKDPVKYSFAHGGKDGYPYPVDRKVMDKTIEVFRNAVRQARIGEKEQKRALERLGRIEYLQAPINKKSPFSACPSPQRTFRDL